MISLLSAIIVPKSEAAQTKRKTQKICTNQIVIMLINEKKNPMLVNKKNNLACTRSPLVVAYISPASNIF